MDFRMGEGKPRVSIGVPVYNGEAFLEAALDSLLAQTFTDFEVIISDNASTERTKEICRAYAARDARFRYYRNETNVGATPNFNRVFGLSTGDYFKWASHDDVLSPRYLERCVDTLDRAPDDVVLVFPRRVLMDAAGRVVRQCDYTPKHAVGDGWEGYHALRFQELVRLENGCIPAFIFGLMRSDALRKTRLIGPFIAGDRACVAEMCLRGQAWQIPEYHFYQRLHAATSWRVQLTVEEDAAWYDPANRGRWAWPNWRLFVNLLIAIRRSELGGYQKLGHYAGMVGFWTSRLGRWRARSGWRAWSWASLEMAAASRHTLVPLRLWVLAGLVRRARGRRVVQALRDAWRMPEADLLSFSAHALARRKDAASRDLLVAWLGDSSECRRVAAASALERFPQSGWEPRSAAAGVRGGQV
jgi:glycosyltransferase involved in cell wall biosynthesis